MSGNAMGMVLGGVLLGAVAGVGGTLAYNQQNQSGSTSSPSAEEATCAVGGAVGNSAASSALFSVDGTSYSAADLPSDVQDVLFQVENQSYRSKRDFLEDVALRVALAKDKMSTVDMKSLPPLSALMEGGEPEESEMKEFFEKNKKNLPPGATYEQIKPQLKQFLANRSLSTSVSKKVSEFEKSGRLQFGFAAPVPPLVQLPVEKYPSKGSASAAHTLVEVSDYLCPHCRDMKPNVEEVVKELGDQLRYVQVDFALRPSGLSGMLAKGSYCAKQQSEELYWKYHDKAFEVPLEAAAATGAEAQAGFKKVTLEAGTSAGVDAAAFEACLDSEEAQTFMTETNKEFSAKGVSGTPTFFLNNRKLVLGGKSLLAAVKEVVEGGTASN